MHPVSTTNTTRAKGQKAGSAPGPRRPPHRVRLPSRSLALLQRLLVAHRLVDAGEPVAVAVNLAEGLLRAEALGAGHVVVAVAVHLGEPARRLAGGRRTGLAVAAKRHHRDRGVLIGAGSNV